MVEITPDGLLTGLLFIGTAGFGLGYLARSEIARDEKDARPRE